LREAPVMDQRSFGTGKIAMAVMATLAGVMLWSFGIEFVLRNYVFISPQVNSVQKIK
jgi:hypothetical protein